MGHSRSIASANCIIQERTPIVNGVQVSSHGKINALIYVCSYLRVNNFVAIPQRIVFFEKGRD